MNKSDIKLVLIIALLCILLLFFMNKNKTSGAVAEVYYEDKKILTLDLNINKTYTVEGAMGEVVIDVKDKKVGVIKENSKNHICSREGYTNSSTKPIICLPNKVVIKVVDNNSDIDGVVK